MAFLFFFSFFSVRSFDLPRLFSFPDFLSPRLPLEEELRRFRSLEGPLGFLWENLQLCPYLHFSSMKNLHNMSL